MRARHNLWWQKLSCRYPWLTELEIKFWHAVRKVKG